MKKEQFQLVPQDLLLITQQIDPPVDNNESFSKRGSHGLTLQETLWKLERTLLHLMLMASTWRCERFLEEGSILPLRIIRILQYIGYCIVKHHVTPLYFDKLLVDAAGRERLADDKCLSH